MVFGEVINEGRRGKVKMVISLNEKVRFGEEGGMSLVIRESLGTMNSNRGWGFDLGQHTGCIKMVDGPGFISWAWGDGYWIRGGFGCWVK